MFILAIWLLSPLLISGFIHLVIIKYNYFSWLAIPVWENGFGKNKTYRGIIVMVLATILGCYFSSMLELLYPTFFPKFFSMHSVIITGFWLGFSYVIFELPNSYLKRRRGIAPGCKSKKHQLSSIIFDHLDSISGVALYYYLSGDTTFKLSLLIVVIGLIIHMFLCYFYVLIKLKKEF